MTTEPEQPAPPALEPVEPGYKNVLRVRFLIFWLVSLGGGDNVRPYPAQGDGIYGFPDGRGVCDRGSGGR